MVVKSKPNEQIKIKDYITDENGQVIEYTPAMQEKELTKAIPKQDIVNFNDLSIEEFEARLDKRLDAVKLIKSKFVEGKHYIHIKGAEKPFMTQEGADLLFTSAGIVLKTEEVKEILDHEKQFYFAIYKAIAIIGDKVVSDTSASANSKEENNIKKFIKQEEDGTIVQRGTKTFYDTINTVIRMAQKRAKVALARQFFALTGDFDEDQENPKANKRAQQGIYTKFYKLFLDLAPKAPTKKKLKNGKWKQISIKDQLAWQKEYVRTKFLQPNLIKLELPTHDWGIKDIEKLKEEMPKWRALENGAKENETN